MLNRSKALLAIIAARISDFKYITVKDFISLALYHSDYGYYMQPDFNIGQDFITAPHLSGRWLAAAIAYNWQQLLRHKSNLDIIEYGPGSGKLCYDLLLECKDCPPNNYYLVELSPALKLKQQQLLKTLPDNLFNKVKWVDSIPVTQGLIIANEFFDAWPVAQFSLGKNIQERCVTIKDNKLNFVDIDLEENTNLYQAVKRLNLKYTNYYSEIQTDYYDWFHTLNQSLTWGGMLILDYGLPQNEYYAPEKFQGTLQCYYQHQVHSDILANIGLQDITSYVDFTALARAANGWQIAGYCTQAQFMLQSGLADRLNDLDLTRQDAFALKQLLLPTEMGHLFKVLGLTKIVEPDWFIEYDKQGIL